MKRPVGVLPGKAGQTSNFFLRKTQRQISDAKELWIEQFSETERDSCRRFLQTEVSNQTDVVSTPCIELIDDKSTERMAIVKQPLKCASFKFSMGGLAGQVRAAARRSEYLTRVEEAS